MKSLIILFAVCSSVLVSAQNAPDESATGNLPQRYQSLKAKSQTYQAYKVIDERVLDGFWKMVTDSVNALKRDQRVASAQIEELKQQVAAVQDSLRSKEASMEEVVYESTHIKVAGISFAKTTFVTLFVTLVLGLLLAFIVALFMLRLARANLQDRINYVNSVEKDFEEHKRRALDREAKIQRQLQDERNRYHSSTR